MGSHPTVDKFCAGCGKAFKSRNRGGNRGWTRFCSTGCSGRTTHFKGGPVASRRRRRYGMEPEEYDKMLRDQGGKCALCLGTPEYELYVDHHHETKENRSLLCAKCNNAVGVFDRLTWDEVLVYWGYSHFHKEGRDFAQKIIDVIKDDLPDPLPDDMALRPHDWESVFTRAEQVKLGLPSEAPESPPKRIGMYIKGEHWDDPSAVLESIPEPPTDDADW